MALENYGNALTTLINQGGGIASGDTTVTVLSTLNWPQPNFRILIETELCLVTSVSSNTFTIVRGIEGTVAAAHANGAPVTQVLTVGGLLGTAGDFHLSDSYAAIPSSSLAGRLFLPNNGVSIYRDTSSSWLPWGPTFPFVPLNNSLYAWVNQGSATLSQSNGGLFLNQPHNAGGVNNIAARVKTLPAAPYTMIMAFLPMIVQADFIDCGMVLRDSSSGDLITFGVAANSFISSFEIIDVAKYTSPTSSGTTYTTSPATIVAPTWQVGPCMWLKIADDNTNRTYSLSNDGINFFTILSTLRTDFITPNQIGFYVNVQNASFAGGINVLSFTGG